MTGNIRKKLTVSATIFMAVLMVLSVAVGPAAATVSGLDASNPESIPGNNQDVTQNITATSASNNISFTATGTNNVALKIDISDLTDAGADISDAAVVDGSGSPGFTVQEDGSANFYNVDTEAEEIQLVVGVDDATDPINITSLELSGIDTSGVSTAQGLDYTIRANENNSGDFGSNFQTDDIATTGTFSIATVEVENLDTGTVVTEKSLSDAIFENNNHDDLDGEVGDNVEIRPNSGTYQVSSTLSITENNLRITPVDGADVTIEDAGSASPSFNVGVGVTGVEMSGLTLDEGDNGNNGIDVKDDAELTVSDSTFTNGGTADYVNTTDDATVLVETSTFEDSDNSATGFNVTDNGTDPDDGDITLSNNEFTGLATALNLSDDLTSNGDGLSAFSATSNTFADDNNVHVNETGDRNNVDLDTIFAENTFEQYAITTRDSDGSIVNDNEYAIYGDLGYVDEGDVTNTTDRTTIVSAGEHDVSSGSVSLPFNVDADNVDIVGAEGANNVNVTVGSTFVQASSDISGLTISGLTLDGNQKAINANGNSLNDLTVTNNRFVNLDAETVIDASGGSDSLNNTEIADNTFESTNEDGSGYTGISVSNIGDPGSSTSSDITADITGNTFTGISGQAVIISALNDTEDDNNDVLLTIQDNEIEQTGNSGNNPTISLSGLNTTHDAETVVDGNTITGVEPGQVTGISVADDSATTVSVTDNTITNLGNDAAIALDLTGLTNTDNVVVENNEFDSNGIHIDYTSSVLSGGDDVTSLRNDNAFATLVFDTANEDDSFEDLNNEEIYGTIGGGINAASADNFVQVTPGTYEESNLATDDANVVSTGSAAETVITGEVGTNNFINIDDDDRVDGFTFQPVGDAEVTDVKLSNGNAVLANSTFVGVNADEPNRQAIDVSDSGTVRSVDVSGYGTAVQINNNNARLEDSTISDSTTGVDLATGSGGVDIVRNTITSNTVGIASATGNSENIHFNDILNNEDAGVDYANSNIDSLRANWWGDANGPEISTDAGADIVEDSEDDIANSNNERPWLTSSYTELPTDQMIVVTDSTVPPADATGADGAKILVAVLNDDIADNNNVNTGSTTFVVDGPDDLENSSSNNAFGADAIEATGSGTQLSASNPLNLTGAGDSIVPASDTPGDYEIQAVNTEDAVDSGSAVQTFSGAVADVDVTTDTTDLTADGETTANVTLQLVDSEGNDVPRSVGSISWSIDNNAAAGIERVNADTMTDANGQATLTVTADTAGETFTVTGIDGNNNNADNVDVNTVEPTTANFTLSLVDGPTTITQNESYSATLSVTNEGDGAGTQDVDYTLEDSNGLSSGIEASEEVSLDAGNSTEITFEVPASATADLETGDYTHVFASDDDELTVDAEVVENVTVPTDPEERALQLTGVNNASELTQDDVTAAITRFERNESANGVDPTQDDVTTVITLFERN